MTISKDDLTGLFADTLNGNDQIRNTAENKLKELAKNPEFLNIIYSELIYDTNIMVRKASSIFLVNTLSTYYEDIEIQSFVSKFEQNIFESLVYSKNKEELETNEKLLQVFYENARAEKVSFIVNKTGYSLEENDPRKVKAAFCAVMMLVKVKMESHILNDILKQFFMQYGQIFANKFNEGVTQKNWDVVYLGMKIIHRMFSFFDLNESLANVNVYNFYAQLAIAITGQRESNESFIKAKKWAYAFLYATSKRGFKKYFKKDELNVFIQKEEVVLGVAHLFMRVIEEYKNGIVDTPKILIYTAKFFDVFASSKSTKKYFGNFVEKVVFDFILPGFKYDENLDALFECDATAYLSERYNFSSAQLRTCISALFFSIVKYNKDYEEHLINILIKHFNSPDIDINLKYGILGLLAEVIPQTKYVLGEEKFYLFTISTVKNILTSDSYFMVSQAFYYMYSVESIKLKDDDYKQLLQLVFKFAQHENDVLKVESCLAMQFFFYTETQEKTLENIIPGLLETILKYNKIYPLEALSSHMEYIIDRFDDLVVDFSPRFVATIVEAVNGILDSKSDIDYYQISMYLSSIEKLAMASAEKENILKAIYDQTIAMIYRIFKNEHYEAFSETIELMNTFLFSMETVDEKAYEIFKVVTSVDPDEICLYTDEMCNFMDNYISFGGNKMVNPEVLNAFYRIFLAFFNTADVEEGLYEDDVICSCNIINALLCYVGRDVAQQNPTFIPTILKHVLGNLDAVYKEKTGCVVNVLDLIMNCIVVQPDASLKEIGNYRRFLYNKIWENSYNFSRVIDKKIYLLFINTLFQMGNDDMVDYDELNKSFVHVFTTLPKAIKDRNNLMKDEFNEEDENDYNEWDKCGDGLLEDIYTYNPYDKINMYEVIKATLSNLNAGSFGQIALSRMKQQQISQIQEIFNTPQEEQKLE